MHQKTALVTGITGQDGAYLAELLLQKNYKVIGTYRRTSSTNFWRIEELGIQNHDNLVLEEYDLLDSGNAIRLCSKYQPDEVYNLAAQSFVGVSFEQPLATAQMTGSGALNLLEAIRIVNPKIKFYQAGTSELYGKVQAIPQDEQTPFYPRSPYAVAKLFAHWATINYRESYDLFAVCGILFNHESPLRGQEFVTRKITSNVARIVNGNRAPLELGNLDAQRDWGYAKDYVEGMWRMLQHKEADTFVLATNKTWSIRQFVDLAFTAAGIHLDWHGKEADEVGRDTKTGEILVKINPRFYRPAEVELLIGNPQKAEKALGWQPKTTLEELCQMMVEADIRRVRENRCF
ncbi:MAG: GDP-mannose 4,6-dehydratase [Holosporales bacterium]